MRNIIKCVRSLQNLKATSSSIMISSHQFQNVGFKPQNVPLSFARQCFSSTNQTHLAEKRNERIERFECEMNTLFPECEEEIKHLVESAPEVLHFDTNKIHQYASIFMQHGEKQPLRPNEALKLFAICPDILSLSYSEVESTVVNLFMRCAKFKLPWTSVFLENTDLVFQDEMIIPDMMLKLSSYSQFNHNELFYLILNNPQIFRLPWPVVQKKVKFLLEEMNVSLKSIAMTRDSLTSDLDFFAFRYKFLKLSGNYKHPSPSQIGSKLMEAEPSFKLICETDDAEFLQKCAPQLTLEELNAFKTLHYIEQSEMLDVLDADDEGGIDQDNYYRLEDEVFSGSYGKSRSGGAVIQTSKKKKKKSKSKEK